MPNRNRYIACPGWLFAAALACAGISTLGAPETALAYCQLKTGEEVAGDECSEDGFPLAWKRRCVSFAVFRRRSDDPPMDDILQAIDDSFASWLEVECDGLPVDLEVRRLKQWSECDVPEHNPNGPNLNSIAFISDWESRPNPPAAFALTSVWHDETTGEILDADMELNDDPDLAESIGLGYYGICPGEKPGVTPPECVVPNLIDIQNVVTHEVGHFFGLGHSKVPGSVMTPQSRTGDLSKRTLKQDDIDGFCEIYPPGSLPEECDFTPRNGLTLECYEPSSSSSCNCLTAGQATNNRHLTAVLMLMVVMSLSLLLRRRPER